MPKLWNYIFAELIIGSQPVFYKTLCVSIISSSLFIPSLDICHNISHRATMERMDKFGCNFFKFQGKSVFPKPIMFLVFFLLFPEFCYNITHCAIASLPIGLCFFIVPLTIYRFYDAASHSVALHSKLMIFSTAPARRTHTRMPLAPSPTPLSLPYEWIT